MRSSQFIYGLKHLCRFIVISYLLLRSKKFTAGRQMLKYYAFCYTMNRESLCVANHFFCNNFFFKRMQKAIANVNCCLIHCSLCANFAGCVTT